MGLTLLLLLLLAACVGLLGFQGLWTNALILCQVLLAAMLASNVFEPLAGLLERGVPGGAFHWDFVALWGVFLTTLILLRLAGDFLSSVKLRFNRVLDLAGGYVLATWTGWLLICFLMFSLHAAPLARDPFGGGFQPQQRMFLRLAPDRIWLGFMQQASRGSLRRWSTTDENETHVFDAEGSFLPRYAARRHRHDTRLPAVVEHEE